MTPNATDLTMVPGSRELFVFFGGIAKGIEIPHLNSILQQTSLKRIAYLSAT
jgi:hypothetical protein